MYYRATEVVLEMYRTEDEAARGIVTEARRDAAHIASHAFGVERPVTHVEAVAFGDDPRNVRIRVTTGR